MKKWLILVAVLLVVGLLATRNLWKLPSRPAPPPRPAAAAAVACPEPARLAEASPPPLRAAATPLRRAYG